MNEEPKIIDADIKEDVDQIMEAMKNVKEGEGKMFSNALPNNGVETERETVLKNMVPPHDKISRLVTERDVPRVVEAAKILHEICFAANGRYNGAYAMHHSQIEDKDPLQLFVTWDRKIIINPVITRHSNYFADSKEACMSFPMEDQVIVPRWQKIEVDYVTIMSDPGKEGEFKLSSVQQEKLSGPESFVWQHEIDHGEGKLIYPIKKEE